MSSADLERAVRDAVDVLIPVIEVIGAVVVFLGAVLAIAQYAGSAVGVRAVSYERVRLTLGRHLALGLEFQLGSDILGTAVSPSFSEIGKLGTIAAIRTLLNFFLQRELREERERIAAGSTEDAAGRVQRDELGTREHP